MSDIVKHKGIRTDSGEEITGYLCEFNLENSGGVEGFFIYNGKYWNQVKVESIVAIK